MTTGVQYLSQEDIIRKVLRELGLANRTSKAKGITKHADFSVRAHINQGHARRTGERLIEFYYVVLYSRKAHETVAANQQQIIDATKALGFQWYVTTRISESTGSTYADISQYPPREQS